MQFVKKMQLVILHIQRYVNNENDSDFYAMRQWTTLPGMVCYFCLPEIRVVLICMCRVMRNSARRRSDRAADQCL